MHISLQHPYPQISNLTFTTIFVSVSLFIFYPLSPHSHPPSRLSTHHNPPQTPIPAPDRRRRIGERDAHSGLEKGLNWREERRYRVWLGCDCACGSAEHVRDIVGW